MTGIDLNLYKERQMKRRIDSLLVSKNYPDYYQFLLALKKDPKFLEDFIEYTTINVSEFFRNPEQWKYLEEEILPKFKSRERITVWSAACSTGDEPYTLAMLMSKYYNRFKFKIIATDIDEKAILMAKAGEYHPKSIANVPEEFMKYFTHKENGKYAISEDIKRLVTFQKHNLFTDEFIQGVDLLVCRNVLIYFTEEIKEKIFLQFHESLNKGGILFLGNTEQMIDYKTIGYSRSASFFYEKL
jgi:chemotaxis protein methyltransferase CheR